MIKGYKAEISVQQAEENNLRKLYKGFQDAADDYLHAPPSSFERLLDWKFGIRIHWGLYSICGNGPESWPLVRGDFPSLKEYRRQYEELHKDWNPTGFDAAAWSDMIDRAGAKFFVFTTKHHDGFSLYHTKTRVRKRLVHTGPSAGEIVDCDLSYSMEETPFKRDVLRELVDAARQRDLGIGLYYSHIDWFDSDFRIDEWNYQRTPSHRLNANEYNKKNNPEEFRRMIRRHREQVNELLSEYGGIDLLSWDMNFPDNGYKHNIRNEIIETVKMVRKMQPDILQRQRGIDCYGDYFTPERSVPSEGEANAKMPWMVIYPGSKNFSHLWGDTYKPAKWIIHNLIDITSKGGVFQVGYGPGPDGRFDKTVVSRLAEVGSWLTTYGEGIYFSRPWKIHSEGTALRFTRSKDSMRIYIFVLDRPLDQFTESTIAVNSLGANSVGKSLEIQSVDILGSNGTLSFVRGEKALFIDLPPAEKMQHIEGAMESLPYCLRVNLDREG